MGHKRLMRIGVVGGGAMGCGIALELAIAGRHVVLFNRQAESSEAARVKLERDAALLVETGMLGAEQRTTALARIHRTTVLAEAAVVQDLVIESIPEDLALKQQLFKELDRLASPDTLLATNTTALSVTAIARDCAHPERVLSAHYYLPAHLVPLVDVIPGEKTSPDAVETVRRFLEESGKSPVVFARDVPGSVGPRLQQALIGEAFRIVQEGVATPEMVDRVLTQGIGRRLGASGIFDRLDLVGLDFITNVLRGSGRPVPPVLAQKVDQGELGLKTGQGFYPWTPDSAAAFEERMARHLITQLSEDRAAGRLPTPESGE
ncbi:3-hydroxyacyl-CoA dehydrogenase family protein [Corallococcus exiguus]|uniref:3-hydroxyacyl-CoA dehydrogenase family protein n=1 Tax=Corallococcus TaxID=83461 RepID=UPI000F880740|nr:MULTISPECIES: 3-hydroxyacyl-CoA dehydrogenase family protein [Corallococcus]NNB84413.1 3-hydroxyacyl-CoA dehydrogenase family protein [Corallococcus exiguus]NNB92694.1 3-hydroxyacyl-CoA dehydrogenase family protein [Corallococcus exiguus]NNC01745.1 3-hydroxyacyl-CoA dehydrogenase family protein [Corallococcus exiguus]RUO94329.1 3-hydroxyacyl-CoA dehydrogenase family protein [Corallococcus sp. AB018]